MSDLAERAASPDQDLDAAIAQARAALSAVLRAPEPSGGPRQVAQARALLASLLYQRLTRAAARLDLDDPAAVSAVRADRNEAIAVSSALLYELPSGGPAWRDVALMVGRLSYDRYRDAGPGAVRPDPDDLDAACDLLMRGAPERRVGRADGPVPVPGPARPPEAAGHPDRLRRAGDLGQVPAHLPRGRWRPRQPAQHAGSRNPHPRGVPRRRRGLVDPPPAFSGLPPPRKTSRGACLTRDTLWLWPRLRSASCATTGARWSTGWPTGRADHRHQGRQAGGRALAQARRR